MLSSLLGYVELDDLVITPEGRVSCADASANAVAVASADDEFRIGGR